MPIYIESARTYRGPGEYVGRPHPRFPPGSPLGNPYRIGSDGTRGEVITRYRGLLRRAWRTGSPAKAELLRLADLYRQARALTLICWCAPHPCHAGVVAQAIYEIAGEEPPDITDPTTRLLITGSRDASTLMLAYARQVVTEAAGNGWCIVGGDALGVDAAVIAECDRLNVPVEVHGAHSHLRRQATHLHAANVVQPGDYPAHDRLMVERADIVYAIWDGTSPGTRRTFEHARRVCKAVRVADFATTPPRIYDVHTDIAKEFRP